MKEILAVTSRNLCTGDFQQQLKRLAQSGVAAIVLREKDLSEDTYLHLAKQCVRTLEPFSVPLVISHRVNAARQLQIKQVQVSWPVFQQNYQNLQEFSRVLVSVHCVEEAVQAVEWGAHGLIAGHIFATDCKRGAATRGLAFLQQICDAVNIPVYAIGGINVQTYPELQCSKAAGVCVMSYAMKQDVFFWENG